MARLLITATHGYDNSTRASLPFFVAKGAAEAGIDVGIVLALDAATLVKPEFRKHVQPYAFPPLEEMFQFAVDHKIPVYVWGLWAQTRGVLDEDLRRIPVAQKIDVKRYAQLLVEYDRSVSYWVVAYPKLSLLPADVKGE